MADVVGNILGDNNLTDTYGKSVKLGDFITDENGNIGKIIEYYGDGALVDFGKQIGKDRIGYGDRFIKGKKW